MEEKILYLSKEQEEIKNILFGIKATQSEMKGRLLGLISTVFDINQKVERIELTKEQSIKLIELQFENLKLNNKVESLGKEIFQLEKERE